MDNNKLMELTRLVLDLKKEKKEYNTEINGRIKETEAEIKMLVKESK
jgi:hypothetical protein